MAEPTLSGRLIALDKTVTLQLRQRLGEKQYALFQRENEQQQHSYATQQLQPLAVGDVAPDFSQPDQDSNNVRLYSLLQHSHVVLHFYRGSWCPFCNLALQAHCEYQSEYEGLDATFVAITPSAPDMTRQQRDCLSCDFPILSDVDGTTIAAYRLQLTLSPALLRLHTSKEEGLGIDFAGHYKDELGLLPVPATFIIERQTRRIVWAHVNADYKQRAEPLDIMLKLADLMQQGDPSSRDEPQHAM